MALVRPQLAAQHVLATPATGAPTIPVNVGRRPFTHLTKAGNQSRFILNRVAGGTAAALGLFGVDLTYDGSPFSTDANGRLLPGYNPVGAPLNLNGVTPNGCYRERIRVSGGSGTGIGFITILDGGSGYTSVPGITFANAGTAAATAVISADGRVVGAFVTNAGTFASNSTITIAAPTSGRQARAALAAGQVTTVNTKIPFATHAPTTAAGAYWVAMWKDRILACSTAMLGLGAATAATAGLEGENQFAEGFTVATGTHPDGTTTIGVLTLARGIPNGSEIVVYRGSVNQLAALGTAAGNLDIQIRTPTLAYLGCTTGAADTGTVTAAIVPAVDN